LQNENEQVEADVKASNLKFILKIQTLQVPSVEQVEEKCASLSKKGYEKDIEILEI